jgi:hypothetical protein
MNIIENIALKRRVEVSLAGINIATYTAAAIFLPYILSTLILISLSLYVIINKRTRQKIFYNTSSNILKLFFLYVLTIPIIYRNWIGLATGIAVILAMILGLYIKSIMTKDLFEKILNLICTFSLTSAGYAIMEKAIELMDGGRGSHRIAAVFFHPNYFGTIVGTVVIICVYKLLTKQGHRWFYFMVAGFNIVSMYLCKSMFVWVEVFIGVAVLLAIFKRHRLLTIWLFAAAAGGFLVLFLNVNIIPRLDDVEVTVRLRKQIWELAAGQIIKAPLVGHGFYSFIYLFNRSYHNQIIPHSHNIYLDMLLNFGLIGTGLLLLYAVKYYISVIKICWKEKNPMITSLILAVTSAALVHGATDITLLWVQTLPLFLLVLSGFGAFERKERVYWKYR